MKKYLTLKQVSEFVPLSRDTLYHLVAAKPPKIPHIKLGGRILFSVSDLEEFLETKRRPAIRREAAATTAK